MLNFSPKTGFKAFLLIVFMVISIIDFHKISVIQSPKDFIAILRGYIKSLLRRLKNIGMGSEKLYRNTPI